ncbi:MAG: aminotransferase class IV family protein [Bacteroidales bacterium]
MFPLFEAIKIIDGVPQHPDWHQARMDDSFLRYFGRPGAPLLARVLKVPVEFRKGIVKCRFLYDRTTTAMEFAEYVPKRVRTLQLVTGDHLEYSMKFTDRYALEELLKQKGSCDDILIVRNGRITDTSYTNIVLFNGERWVTPIYPLLAGTGRNRLISEGRIAEADITVENLRYYKSFRLINAMLGFDEQEELPVDLIMKKSFYL